MNKYNDCVQLEVKRRTDHPILFPRALSRPNCMTDHQSTTTYEYNTYIVLPLRKDKLRIIHTFPLLELLVLNKTPR